MASSSPTRRRFLQGTLSGCLLPALDGARAGAAIQRIVYPRHIETLDDRYDYDWLILRTALEKSAPAFGPFEMRQLDEAMSPPRVAQELTLAKGRINVLARATSPAVEQQFLPIRIPIDKGLLGLRVFLVRAVDLPRFAAVRSVQDLRAMRAGQGKDWADVSILRAAGIPVVEGTFERLYSMLMAGRFDFYSRGVDEAPRELSEAQGKYPGMTLEPSLLLEYPLPRYVFVRRDAEGERLARRITAGLESMVQDGTLNALFRKHKGPVIERCGLEKRRVLSLRHPGISPETPLNRQELWYRPQTAT
jgi:ABC-type amino acid transport substrate-binding protein